MNENVAIDKSSLSIIVPVYKAERYLDECVQSILCQTFKDFELILVNDGSPDNSGVICQKYAQKDQRVKVIHKKNGGASSARNAGLDVVTGDYIGWVDADDRIAPDMFARLMGLIKEYDADIADSQFYWVNGNQLKKSGLDEPIVYGDGDFIFKEFFAARMKPGLVTKVYRSELWHNIRFPLGRIHQDCYVNMRFALMPLKYVRTSEAKYYYIIRDNSITTTRSAKELRQTVYRYDYTMKLAKDVATSKFAKKILTKDAINRLIIRYFDVSVNSNLKNQYVYNYFIRKKLGFSLFHYLITASLPIKTRVSLSLLMLNMKSLQIFLHKKFGNQ
ncbi:glycosyltransferase family 2 protein [Saccharicrinis sp. 156]|uniref:glycosyltransferase family 2 protein n=1 Tax=Saccharicrinis sp. 156 TaxID=3417574 RepID=UPI003D34A2FF